MSDIDTEAFPKGALVAMAALLTVAIGGAGAARLVRLSTPAAPVTAPTAEAAIDLRFADQPDGSIAVIDARSGASISTVAPDTGGFVRGVMRGLAHDRLSRHLDAGPPFRLSRDHAGKLWLQDTATQRLIDLEAFGEGNRASFAAFLPPENASASGARA